VELTTILPAFAGLGGALFATCPLTIRHVSMAELEASATAPRVETPATARLMIRAEPNLLVVDLIGLEPAGRALQTFPPVRIARRRIDTGPMLWPVAGALLRKDEIVTLRFATATGDNLLAPPLNRLNPSEDTWLVRVSGGVFADQVRRALEDATNPPPAGTEVEDPATASWMPTVVNAPGSVAQWGAVGNVGVIKPDACPTLFGSVDVSVGITAVLTIEPDVLPVPNPPPPTTASVWLRIKADASDWDAFRCWAGSAGLASLILGVVASPFTGIAAGISSLVLMGDYIRSEAMTGVGGNAAPGFTRVNQDGSTVLYRSTLPLTGFGNQTKDVTVDGDGLTIVGEFPELAAADHAVEPLADDHNLAVAWSGHYDCRAGHWEESLEVAPLIVRDRVTVLGTTVGMNLVTVFPTTRVTTSEAWQVVVTPNAVDPVVRVVARNRPKPGATGRLYLHTSCGVWRFDIDPAPPLPERDPLRIMNEAVNCRQFLVEKNPKKKIGWLVDPPPFDLGIPPLRQWLLSLPRVPEGAGVSVQRVRGEEWLDEAIALVAQRTGPIVVELVTDADTELVVEHSFGAGGRVTRRWLLPVHVVDLPAPATAIARAGDHIRVVTGGRLMTVHRGLGEIEDLGSSDHKPDGLPYSLTLRNGMVATAWEDKLVIAVPWGGASPRWVIGRTPSDLRNRGQRDMQTAGTLMR
jgi:hypothetical protein